MADHSESKKLAEAAPEGPWFGPEYAPGTSHVFDVDLGALLAYESIDSEKDACLRYVAAANPAAVLALIAENESLKGPHDWLAEDLIKELVDNAQAIQENADDGEDDPFVIVLLASASRIRRQEANIDKLRAENERLAKTADCWDRLNVQNKALSDSFRAERDQLRAEVAGLRTGYEAYERVNAELKAEVEKLRKELAARHPFKFAQESPAIGFTGCVICGVYTDHGGLPCPKTRATAIAHAAMGKGERS
ncbi:hypothetical protein [Pseudomonas lundensis]|uniref:hypothetical protein n=1 Tax=Pseudomonas lundensis TaxID=86185 RepID=UPI00385D0992